VTNELWKPPVDAPPTQSLNAYKAMALGGFSAATMLTGVFDTLGLPLPMRYLVSLPMAAAATMWCIVDAASRGGYYLHSLRWVTMLTWPIAVPVYLVQSRKARGFLLVLFGAVAMLILEVIGNAIGGAWFGSR